jgi:hypothetical protein
MSTDARRRPPGRAAGSKAFTPPDRTICKRVVACRLDLIERCMPSKVTACTCWDCCTVDAVASDPLRTASPLAEYVSRRVEVLG